MAHFALENLTFSYPETDRKVLDDVTLFIEAGEYVALCGKSGCGKTTLLRHLKSVLTPHGVRTGTILFNGTPLEEVSLHDQSCQIGFVMQNPDSQIVTDKVWHELAFGLESLGFDQRTIRMRVAEMASYFGIQNWFHKDVCDLSGGQKQLLNLASVMAMQPSVLILDEPTSQLDPIAATDFLNTVRKINRELGTTIIVTEHRLEEVWSAADRIVVMDKGKITSNGNPRAVGDELYRRNDEMIPALPAPMRIFYRVVDEDRIYSITNPGDDDPCPMTVREGRSWLSVRYGLHAPPRTKLPDDQPFDAIVKNPVVRLKDVWFRYERDLPDIVKGATFDVPQGTLFAMVGGNGTGKSTTMKLIDGVEKPYRGSIEILGKKIQHYKGNSLHRNCVSMLPQDPQNVFVKSTVHEDLWEMLADTSLSSNEKETKITQVANTCDIVPVLESHPFDLSGGEQQRAALAKVLLTDPQILLLDEPSKGVDNFFKQKLSRVFQKLKDQGVTIIMVSHDVEFCAAYADSVSMFFDGSIVTTNTPRRFFSYNSFYTTAANRMSRHVFQNAITDKDVIALCRER